MVFRVCGTSGFLGSPGRVCRFRDGKDVRDSRGRFCYFEVVGWLVFAVLKGLRGGGLVGCCGWDFAR